MISRDTPRYHAYLMRCWQDQDPHVTDPLAYYLQLNGRGRSVKGKE